MKITKEQLTQLIREEAIKYKKVSELENKKAEIEKQLNEMCSMGAEQPGEMDEILGFGKKTEKTREQWSQEIIANAMKKIEAYKASSGGKLFPTPKWATAGTPEHEKAIDAAMKLQNADIYFNTAKGTFLPRSYSAKGHTFGGGSDAVALEENKKKSEEKKK